MFIDMDRLKHLNDSYDHATGDKAILSVANAILSSMPEHAIPVRYGGDEFLVFIPCEEINVIERMLDGFMKILPVEARKQGVPEPLSVSYGMILTDPSSGKTIGEYVRDADALMYEQKRAKKCQRM